MLGKWAAAHLILFGAMVLLVIVFEIEKKLTILLLTLLPPAGFVLLELTYYQFLPFTEYISPEIQAKTYLSGGITGFAFVLFQVIIYRNTNHDFQTNLQKTKQKSATKKIDAAKQIQKPLLPNKLPVCPAYDRQGYSSQFDDNVFSFIYSSVFSRV